MFSTHLLIPSYKHHNTHAHTDLVVSCTDMQRRVTASVLLIDVRAVEYQLFHLLNSAALARLHSTEHTHGLAVWCSGNVLVSINAVALHRAHLVLGWVTAFGQVNCLIT